MAETLDRYRQKRNFARTPEPAGQAATARQALSFVVQKHAARRLHYDFRLELDGVLKSWAVPKGPSLDPADKRMAVHVEDHPLEYGSFEGVIPPKQYGAGTVIVWDRGRWIPQGDPHAGYRAGKLKFELDGEKLKGGWTLVRMHGRAGERQEPWLLIKERDAQARPAAEFDVVDALPDSVLSGVAQASTGAAPAPAADIALPAGAKPAALPLTLAPQLATLVDRAPRSGDWSYEIKFDGYRLLARLDGRDLRLYTRNGNDWTSRMKGLAAALAALKLPPGWYDGEIVVLDAAGVPDFNALQNAFDSAHTEDIRYYLFDIPYCAGHDLRQVPLAQRRALLARLLAGATGAVRYSEDFHTTAEDILQSACQMRLEGVIGKRRDAPYVSRRAPTWIKLKCTQRQEFVIGGYTDPQGSRPGIGSLHLGLHDASGALRYAGNVGTGFDVRTLQDLRRLLEPLTVEATPFADKPRAVKGHWVQPKLVAEVSFAEWTKDGRVRHAVFHGLRRDKSARTVTKEVAQALPAPRRRAPKVPDLGGMRISNPERVIDTTTGYTKIDLVNHYLGVARRMLPHLEHRPVALVRAPSGVQGQHFFQKHADTLKIPGLKLVDPDFLPGHPPMIEIGSFEALVGAAQMNVIEFHTSNATTRALDRPDRLTFDLDPGEGLEWPAMREAAELMHGFLEELGLRSFLKTSGGKGLHVVVPLTPREDWDAVKDFSQAVVQHLARVLPTRFVAKSGPKNRVGRIFVDYLRNSRGATTVCAYSARARPGMGVSMPCGWDELPQLTSGAQWTLGNAHERLDAGDEPWAGYASTRQTLAAARKKLGRET